MRGYIYIEITGENYMSEYQVVFQPSGRRGKIEEGTTLLAAARKLGVSIEAACGGMKVCGKCKVIVETGKFEKLNIDSHTEHVSPLSAEEAGILGEEAVSKGYRLACFAVLHGDVVVTVPEESRSGKQVILEEGSQRNYILNPAVKIYPLELNPASFEDYADDSRRIIHALQEKYHLPEHLVFDYTVLRNLPAVIRDNNWKISVFVWQDKEIIKILPENASNSYGIAIDIGTTTLAAYLCNISTGELLQKSSQMNPQISYGEDVLARISYIQSNPDGLEKLHQEIISAVNELTAQMTAEQGLSPEDVDEIVLVYNTAMHHIALNIEPKYLGRSPFVPAVKESLDIKARDLGIRINPAGNIHSLPIEAGFVGPDNVSVLIAEEPYKDEKVHLIIDIGTNGEIDLGNQEKLLSTSCATGPALEGAQIKFGMRAAPGAIEKVEIDPVTKEPRYKVIGNETWYPENQKLNAQGICGSGIIDVIAEMFKAGIIKKTGRINTDVKSERIRKNADNKLEYVLAFAEETAIHQDIVITQGDIREVQLAKAAIYVGAKYLLKKYGADAVEDVTLAGAFGSYINKESAMVLGLFPDCDLEKVRAVGNAAGDGARIALLNREKRTEANTIARKVEFVETAVEAEFQKQLMDAIAIPHAKDAFPHLSHILEQIPKG